MNDAQRNKIKSMIYDEPNVDAMWLVSVVYLNAFNEVEQTRCYFDSRYCAEHWFSDFVSDGRPYYAYVCDNKCWNKVEELGEATNV